MATKHFRMPRQTLQTENEVTEEESLPILDFISSSNEIRKDNVLQNQTSNIYINLGPNEEKNTQITLRISKVLLAQVDERAKELNMSRASFIKAVLSIALKDGLKI